MSEEEPKAWDVVPAAIAATRLPAIAETVRSLLAKIAEPVAEELGLLLSERVETFRLRNQVRALEKTQRLCDGAGINPQSIPLRTLVPLLEGASWEEDETLQDMWAALIANAAAEPTNVPPAFASIMRELSPGDAALLSSLFVRDGRVVNSGTSPSREGLGSAEYTAQQISLDNLERLGVIKYDEGGPRLTQHSVSQAFVVVARGTRRLDPDEHVEYQKEWVDLTALGTAFLTASLSPIAGE